MKLTSALLATLTVIASAAASPYGRRDEATEAIKAPDTVATPVIPEYAMMYGYNPPRTNPDYCQGFRIDHPATPGLVFADGSHQYIQWSVDDAKVTTNVPEIVFRARVLNGTQHNHLNVGESIPLYNKGKTGSVFYPLKVDNVDGLYHVRLMVKYAGQELNCVYESVPFMVVHDPTKKYTVGKEPYFDTKPSYSFLAKSIEDLYYTSTTTTAFV